MSHGILPLDRVRFALFAVCSGLLVPAAAQAMEKIGDIEVNVQPVPNKDSSSGTARGTCHGYVEFRVQLKNSSTKDHTVHLTYPAEGRSGQVKSGMVASRTVHVAGGQEASVSLYQPPAAVANEDMEVRVEGVRDSRVIPVASLYGWQGGKDYAWRAVLLSRNVPQDFRDRAHANAEDETSPARGGTSSSSPRVSLLRRRASDKSFAFLRSDVPVGQWSGNWSGYSCYDAILLTEDEVEVMPAQVLAAIRRYVECGGSLLIHGRNVPAAFAQGGVADGDQGYFVGFGYTAASLDNDKSDWDATLKKLLRMPIHIYQPSGTPNNPYDMLVAESPVPVRGLFALILLFGIIIGPANIMLLSKYNRRIWLWWDVPAISLLTCLAVFGYALASEGWVGRDKNTTLTFLDERCHRATTIGYLSYFCPLTPWMGLRFDTDTEVALLVDQPADWRSSVGRVDSPLRIVDWSNYQHLISGWITARVPAYFQIRKNEDRRERLTVKTRGDGSLAVVNALGANVRRLWLADSSGHVFEGRDIPAGAERTLVPLAEGVKASGQGLPDLRTVFTTPDWLGAMHAWMETSEMAARVAPDNYVALLANSPFLESPLAGVRVEASTAIVYGICKGPDNGR